MGLALTMVAVLSLAVGVSGQKGLMTPSVSPPPDNPVWSMRSGDPRHSSNSLYEAQYGILRWSVAFDDDVVASVSIDNNNTAFYQNRYNKFYAVDTTTGTLKWSYTAAANAFMNGQYVTPSIGPDNTVYFGGLNKVLAMNGSTGGIKWSSTVTGLWQGSVVVNGTLYFLSSPSGPSSAFVGAVIALNATTGGSPLWSASVSGGSYMGNPTYFNGTLVFGGQVVTVNTVSFLNANTGATIGTFVDSSSVAYHCSPRVSNDGIAYIGGSTGTILAFYINGTNLKMWSYASGAGQIGTGALPWWDSSMVFLGSNAANTGKVFALNSKTGAVLPNYPVSLGGTYGTMYSHPVLTPGKLMVIGSGSTLFVLNVSTPSPAVIYSYSACK